MGCGPSKPGKKRNRLRDNFVVERQKQVEDDYTIIETIGKGSIGIIYLAENRIPKHYNLQRSRHSTRRQYAIKEIDDDRIDKRSFDSLKTEVSFLKRLDHPFIIKIFGSYSTMVDGGDKEKLSVVMELCTGGTLDRFAPYPEDTAKILVTNILQAVWYLHNNKVIHRDLKLENILFASKERNPNDIRLIDFGLAKVFSWSKNLHERAGTIYTMSPEALRGDYNEKADMWSVGVCTYQILSGKRPFWGDTKDDIAERVKKGRFSLAGPEWIKISREAKSFVRCLLQFDPVLRCDPVEALKLPWLRNHTESNISVLPKENFEMIKIVRDSTSPMNEMQKLALYAVAHKTRAEDMEKLREIFLKMTKDALGEITLPEMKRCLEGEYTHDEIEAWFHRADIEKTNSINFTEFVASSLGVQAKLSCDDVIEAFRIFDRDDSGYITAANLRDALQIEEGDYIDSLIMEADEAGDGQISFREFRDFLMKNKLEASTALCQA